MTIYAGTDFSSTPKAVSNSQVFQGADISPDFRKPSLLDPTPPILTSVSTSISFVFSYLAPGPFLHHRTSSDHNPDTMKLSSMTAMSCVFFITAEAAAIQARGQLNTFQQRDGSISCAHGQTVICSEDGAQYGLCDPNNDNKAILQPVAAGTKCENGGIVNAVQQRSTCSGDQTLICSVDGSQFGQCDSNQNNEAVMRPVASGTKCENGEIVHVHVEEQQETCTEGQVLVCSRNGRKFGLCDPNSKNPPIMQRVAKGTKCEFGRIVYYA